MSIRTYTLLMTFKSIAWQATVPMMEQGLLDLPMEIWPSANYPSSGQISQVHSSIFTLANNFLRWTYFGPTRFIHWWMTVVHMTLCIIEVIDKWNSWLADITFDWRHAMEMAVEHSNHTCQFITFWPLILQDLHQIFTNNEQKWCKNKM